MRASLIVAAWPRSANAAPRKMIPAIAEEERDEERREYRAERQREGGPEDHEHEDQPDVVRLPDRRHRALDHAAHAPAALGPAGGEVPEAGAEVGARRAPRRP